MDISKYLETISVFLGAKFVLYGKHIENSKVFSSNGLLPAFTKRAEENSRFTLNKSLPANFKKSPNAVANIEVSFDESVPNSYRILCITDVLIDLMQRQSGNEKFNLDELLYD